jgi:hypothetical protein
MMHSLEQAIDCRTGMSLSNGVFSSTPLDLAVDLAVERRGVSALMREPNRP